MYCLLSWERRVAAFFQCSFCCPCVDSFVVKKPCHTPPPGSNWFPKANKKIYRQVMGVASRSWYKSFTISPTIISKGQQDHSGSRACVFFPNYGTEALLNDRECHRTTHERSRNTYKSLKCVCMSSEMLEDKAHPPIPVVSVRAASFSIPLVICTRGGLRPSPQHFSNPSLVSQIKLSDVLFTLSNLFSSQFFPLPSYI